MVHGDSDTATTSCMIPETSDDKLWKAVTSHLSGPVVREFCNLSRVVSGVKSLCNLSSPGVHRLATPYHPQLHFILLEHVSRFEKHKKKKNGTASHLWPSRSGDKWQHSVTSCPFLADDKSRQVLKWTCEHLSSKVGISVWRPTRPNNLGGPPSHG